MKETGTTNWTTHACQPGCATNTSGFTALPDGYRNTAGSFGSVGIFGHWWAATESTTSGAWRRALLYTVGSVNRDAELKKQGFSVRCIKD